MEHREPFVFFRNPLLKCIEPVVKHIDHALRLLNPLFIRLRAAQFVIIHHTNRMGNTFIKNNSMCVCWCSVYKKAVNSYKLRCIGKKLYFSAGSGCR